MLFSNPAKFAQPSILPASGPVAQRLQRGGFKAQRSPVGQFWAQQVDAKEGHTEIVPSTVLVRDASTIRHLPSSRNVKQAFWWRVDNRAREVCKPTKSCQLNSAGV